MCVRDTLRGDPGLRSRAWGRGPMDLDEGHGGRGRLELAYDRSGTVGQPVILASPEQDMSPWTGHLI